MSRAARSTGLQCLVILCLCSVSTSMGQSRPRAQSPFFRPTVSPYLQLGRSDVSPGVSYFNQVRPQKRFTQALQQQQGQLNMLSTDQRQMRRYQGEGVSTGHTTYFNNVAPYFVYPQR